MVEGRFKSRTFRRLKVKTPGGRVVMHHVKRTPKAAHCAECKKILQGVPRGRAIDMKKLAKSEKRPERPYGGVLCSACTRRLMRERAAAV